jgi:hypothetical protein
MLWTPPPILQWCSGAYQVSKLSSCLSLPPTAPGGSFPSGDALDSSTYPSVVLRRPIRYPVFPDIGLNRTVQNVPGPTMPYVLAPRPPHSHRFMISIVAPYVRFNTDSDVSVMFSVQREVWGLPRGTSASRQLAVIPTGAR